MSKVFLAFAILAMGIAPLPASAKTYYIVKDTSTNHCRVSLRKPQGQIAAGEVTGHNRVLQVGTETFTTEEDAKTALKSAQDCQQP